MVTHFDRFGPLEARKGSPETTLDCFARNVTTTVLESWEVFSCCRKVSAYRRKFFYVVGTAVCYFRGYLKLRGCIFLTPRLLQSISFLLQETSWDVEKNQEKKT